MDGNRLAVLDDRQGRTDNHIRVFTHPILQRMSQNDWQFRGGWWMIVVCIEDDVPLVWKLSDLYGVLVGTVAIGHRELDMYEG